MYRQRSNSRICPDEPLLEGKNVLVTGGTAGVGEFVSRGLLRRGAQVVSLSRGVSQGKAELSEVQSIKCDLSDLHSVTDAVEQIKDRQFDVLICNSGIWLPEKKLTASGIEMTFAVNVLGHHLLYQLMFRHRLFAEDARIIMTTGEAYVVTDHCDANPEVYKRSEAYGGTKLGNLWQMRELVRRCANVRAYAVHPGVILSGFGGFPDNSFRHWLAGNFLISEDQGAQAALIAATQDLPNGTYWHNVCGVMNLPDNDPSMNTRKSADFWDELEELTAAYR
ncbi:MAG: SDR family NAD(P)-dependent oxidoreductase [Pseudomonadota bacterium]